MARVVEVARAAGWTVDVTGGGHYRFVPPDPAVAVFFASRTPGDHRWLRIVRVNLRRRGLDV